MNINSNVKIRIGTRDSALAVWQAQQVQDFFTQQSIASEIIFIKSDGDADLITPLYAIGVQGVFTKSLDAALLNSRIDVAVHSLKDVPIQTAKGLQQAAVLKRHSAKDILVYKTPDDRHRTMDTRNKMIDCVIATGSIRRAAQWKNRFPNHTIENLRGNVNTRLHKLEESTWNGAIFAAAGLERLGIRPENSIDLDWMLPAPAQGAVAVFCRKNDVNILEACQLMNDIETELCTKIERDFLNALAGGCAAPISALATMNAGVMTMTGNILSPTGSIKIETEISALIGNAYYLGERCAEAVLNKGADKLIAKHERYIARAINRQVELSFTQPVTDNQSAVHNILPIKKNIQNIKNLVLQ